MLSNILTETDFSEIPLFWELLTSVDGNPSKNHLLRIIIYSN